MTAQPGLVAPEAAERLGPTPDAEAARLAAVGLLFRQVGDLKRIRVAHADGSCAERAFVRAWRALIAGQDPDRVAARECAAALAGATLAGMDADVLHNVAGLSIDATAGVLRRAVAEVADAVHPWTAGWASDAVTESIPDRLPPAAVRGGEGGELDGNNAEATPEFVTRLCRQPRAGATAPGRPRIVTEPPESHGDHCWAVAVYGALLAHDFGASPGDAFLLGMGHHLHGAYLPDAGFAGEVLLGDQLDAIVQRLTVNVLQTLPLPLVGRLGALLDLRENADTPTGRAFHAADVLDRVLQVQHHARAAAFTAAQALDDLDLVHDGPVAGFHADVLRAARL